MKPSNNCGFTLSKDPLPKNITYEWLVDNDACNESETFKELFPDGTELTEGALDKLIESGIDVDFIVRAAYNIYEGKMRERLHEKTTRDYKHHGETRNALETLARKADEEFSRKRIKALAELVSTENIPTSEGEQYRLDFGGVR
jgi:hypothetical protein